MSIREAGIDNLRKAAEKASLHPDFHRVSWTGVFGSFARGTQHDESDVDIVVLRRPREPGESPPSPDTKLLEDVLPQSFGRFVDIIYLKEDQTEFRGYIQLEALLTSHTIFLRSQTARKPVERMRQLANEVLKQGNHFYTDIAERIKETRARVAGMAFETFLETPEENKKSIAAEIRSILDDLDIKPVWHPMHEMFWYIVLEDASMIRARFNNSSLISRTDQHLTEDEVRLIWDVLTLTKDGGLRRLLGLINRFVLPLLAATERSSKQLEDISTLSPTSIVEVGDNRSSPALVAK